MSVRSRSPAHFAKASAGQHAISLNVNTPAQLFSHKSCFRPMAYDIPVRHCLAPFSSRPICMLRQIENAWKSVVCSSPGDQHAKPRFEPSAHAHVFRGSSLEMTCGWRGPQQSRYACCVYRDAAEHLTESYTHCIWWFVHCYEYRFDTQGVATAAHTWYLVYMLRVQLVPNLVRSGST